MEGTWFMIRWLWKPMPSMGTPWLLSDLTRLYRPHSELPMGVDVPTLFAAPRAELPGARITHAEGCAPHGPAAPAARGAAALTAESRLAQAARAAADAADRSGLFGRGTSGEGCDAADLELPGDQSALLDTPLATGTPVVLVLLTGRPYALGRWSGPLAAAVGPERAWTTGGGWCARCG